MLHTLHIVAHLTYCCTPYILLHTLNIVAHINFTPGMFSPTPPLQSGHAKRKSTHQAVNGRIAPGAKKPCSRCKATLHRVQAALHFRFACLDHLWVCSQPPPLSFIPAVSARTGCCRGDTRTRAYLCSGCWLSRSGLLSHSLTWPRYSSV